MVFSESNRISLDTGFQENHPETYRIRMTCGLTAYKFKLFLSPDIGHIEFQNNKGNVLCVNGGNKDIWGGERHNFWYSPLTCDGSSQIIQITRTRTELRITNKGGKELFYKRLDTNDGNCLLLATSVRTHVWGNTKFYLEMGKTLRIGMCDTKLLLLLLLLLMNFHTHFLST